MRPEDHARIRDLYLESGGDSRELFRALVQLSSGSPLDEALACLEACVTEKRLAWFEREAPRIERTGNPIIDGYVLFYVRYLGLFVPRDGEFVSQSDTRVVTRWWNRCPTLDACCALGLDTREICRKVYERPVQVLLQRVDPRLRFTRNYERLRPYAPYCEEILTLEP